jgi:hypothetical protein
MGERSSQDYQPFGIRDSVSENSSIQNKGIKMNEPKEFLALPSEMLRLEDGDGSVLEPQIGDRVEIDFVGTLIAVTQGMAVVVPQIFKSPEIGKN